MPIMDGQRWCHVCGSKMEMEAIQESSKIKEIILTLLKCLAYYLVYYFVSYVVKWIYVGYCARMCHLSGLPPYSGGEYSEAFWAIFSKSYSYVMIIAYMVMFLVYVVWFISRNKDPLRELGVKKFSPAHIPGMAAFGLSIQAVTSITIAIISMLAGPIGEKTHQSYDNMLGSETTIPVFIFMAVATPIIEEIIFRGLIHGRMRRVLPAPAAVVMSSVCFGLCHGEFYRVVYATLLGVVLAVFCEKYDSILPGIVIHMAFNSMSFVYEFLPNSDLVYLSIYFIAMGVALAAAVCFFAKSSPSERKTINETL